MRCVGNRVVMPTPRRAAVCHSALLSPDLRLGATNAYISFHG